MKMKNKIKEDLKMGEKKLNVKLIAYTEDINKLPALAAKLCYSASSIEDLMRKVKASEQDKFLQKIQRNGHLSVLEHGNFTFGIEGISRATSHQLVRHRIASYSQQSQRYVKFQTKNGKGGFDFIIPPSILALSGEWIQKFIERMGIMQEWYDEFAKLVPAEDARYFLPNAAETKIIVTMNIRELLHFFTLRCCNKAQWEIHNMADAMLKLVKEKTPVFFKNAGPPCLRNKCPNDNPCGKIKDVRAKYLANQYRDNYKNTRKRIMEMAEKRNTYQKTHDAVVKLIKNGKLKTPGDNEVNNYEKK